MAPNRSNGRATAIIAEGLGLSPICGNDNFIALANFHQSQISILKNHSTKSETGGFR